MKLLKSKCQKIWLFDAAVDDTSIRAGLACFLTECPAFASFEYKGKTVEAALPLKAINSGVPVRIRGARLFLQ